MLIPKNFYSKLTSFAYIPVSVLENALVSINKDELFFYLSFSYDKAYKEQVIKITDTYALFNTGLKKNNSEELFAYFELNKNQKQKWYLKTLDTQTNLSTFSGITAFPQKVCDISDFNISFRSFAFAHDEKFSSILNLFNNDLNSAKNYISDTFLRLYKCCYVLQNIDNAIFNTGLKDNNNEYLYAYFVKNTRNVQKWFLNGFFAKHQLKNIVEFPQFWEGNDSMHNSVHHHDKSNSYESSVDIEKSTLLVTALPVEYDALTYLLDAKGISYDCRSITDLGKHELNYIYIKKLNTYAIQAGQSFECIIPIIQCILKFNPSQAILSGIAFSFDMSKAPFNSIVVSNQVWDYETAKINEDNVRYRGNKLPASAALKQLFNEKLAITALVRKGIYASGMKVVNSLDFQNKMKDFEPEVLAGDEESFFFAHSCSAFKLDWIVVKAISDYGQNKGDNIQNTASRSALSFVIDALSSQSH